MGSPAGVRYAARMTDPITPFSAGDAPVITRGVLNRGEANRFRRRFLQAAVHEGGRSSTTVDGLERFDDLWWTRDPGLRDLALHPAMLRIAAGLAGAALHPAHDRLLVRRAHREAVAASSMDAVEWSGPAWSSALCALVVLWDAPEARSKDPAGTPADARLQIGDALWYRGRTGGLTGVRVAVAITYMPASAAADGGRMAPIPDPVACAQA